MSRFLARAATVSLTLFVSNVYGFNAAGHKTIAEVAWRKMDAAQRKKIVAILREHPRFDEDFNDEMPDEVRDQGFAAQDHWVFCQAAIWPDIARSQATYHRARWHYINLPLFLSDDQAAAFNGNLPANVEFALPSGVDEKHLNGVQAVKNSLRIINSSTASDKDKAVHYCWLLHVIPDLAQPLHSSAFFTEEVFPLGDQGGNKIRVRRVGTTGGGQKLHAVWDGLLGKSNKFNTILGKADQIINDYPAEFGAPFAALPDDVWSTESQALAVQFAYAPLLNAIEEAEENGGPLGVIEVPASYYTQAGEATNRQAVTAGVRLAGVLAGTVPSGTSPHTFAVSARGVDFPALVATRAGKSDDVTAKTRGVSRKSADDRLAQRVDELEVEVKRLRTLINSNKSSRSVKAESKAVASYLEGDGEQCDCGIEHSPKE